MTLSDLRTWLEEIVADKGLDPKKVIDMDNGEMLSFNMTLNDGATGRAFILDTDDGYFALGCVDAIVSLMRFSELVWFKATSAVDLMASVQTGKGNYYGMASIRIKPQSVEELRQELATFVTRLGLAVEAFRNTQDHDPKAVTDVRRINAGR